MDPPGQNWRIFKEVVFWLLVSFALFAVIRTQARPPPRTMNKEYQEATNEYLKASHLESFIDWVKHI